MFIQTKSDTLQVFYIYENSKPLFLQVNLSFTLKSSESQARTSLQDSLNLPKQFNRTLLYTCTTMLCKFVRHFDGIQSVFEISGNVLQYCSLGQDGPNLPLKLGSIIIHLLTSRHFVFVTFFYLRDSVILVDIL